MIAEEVIPRLITDIRDDRIILIVAGHPIFNYEGNNHSLSLFHK